MESYDLWESIYPIVWIKGGVISNEVLRSLNLTLEDPDNFNTKIKILNNEIFTAQFIASTVLEQFSSRIGAKSSIFNQEILLLDINFKYLDLRNREIESIESLFFKNLIDLDLCSNSIKKIE